MRPYRFTPRSADIRATFPPKITSFALSPRPAFCARTMTPAGSLMV